MDEGSDRGFEADVDGPPESSAPRAIANPWRRLGSVVALVAIALSVLVVRVLVEAESETRAAQQAAADGRVDAQIVHLGHVARWRLPLASHDERAIAQLLELGRAQTARGEPGRTHALAAHREARRAILATRVWGVHDRRSLDAANRAIAELMAQETGNASDAERFFAQLDAEPGPAPIGGKLAAFAFLGWVVVSVGFALRAIDGKGLLKPRAARRWGGACLALLLAWMVLMRWPELLG